MTRDEALRILGLKQGASREEIQVAYRELAQMLHPDKFAENAKLRARAEQQMRTVNEARDTLLSAGASRRASSGSASRAARNTTAEQLTPEQIAFEAEARAHAAETARLTVIAQIRTLRERRRSMGGMAAAALIVALLTYRASGLLGGLAFSIASMLVVWGAVDFVMLSSQIQALRSRASDLLRQRDAARSVAHEARTLSQS